MDDERSGSRIGEGELATNHGVVLRELTEVVTKGVKSYFCVVLCFRGSDSLHFADVNFLFQGLCVSLHTEECSQSKYKYLFHHFVV